MKTESNSLLDSLQKNFKENQIPVRVPMVILKMALREVEMQKAIHGETIFTKSVLAALNGVMEK